ncbi:MAG: DapH/DapD/GlmU-related protein [Sediminispirochaetaceae bacterium]
MRDLRLLQSRYLQVLVTLLASVMYVVALGLCFWIPSLWLSAHLAQYIETILAGTYGSWYIVRFSIIIAVSVWLFVVSSVLIMGLILRLTTFRIKPGRYRIGSLTSMRWMFASGFYGIASHFVLPLVRNTFFLIWFYRLIGAKIGRYAQLNSYSLPDAYLLRVGDNVVIGAGAEISCHVFQGKMLVLEKIEIGDNVLVGAHSYIGPGVVIGENSVLGINSLLRRGTRLPAGSKVAGLAALPLSTLRELEKRE